MGAFFGLWQTLWLPIQLCNLLILYDVGFPHYSTGKLLWFSSLFDKVFILLHSKSKLTARFLPTARFLQVTFPTVSEFSSLPFPLLQISRSPPSVSLQYFGASPTLRSFLGAYSSTIARPDYHPCGESGI